MTVAQDKVMKSAAENKFLIGVKDLQVWLNRSGQKVVEVGFGMGESLHMMSAHNTDDQYLGIDVYKPGVAALLKKIGLEPVNNLSVMHDDAIDVLSMLPSSESLVFNAIVFVVEFVAFDIWSNASGLESEV